MWSSDIEQLLEKIRINAVILSKEHKKKFFYLNNLLRYFRVPIIIISGVSSIISVGFQPYLNQKIISMLTCLLSLLCSIIGSIELYLAVQTQMENELLSSKDYYILSIDIFKMLNLNVENRNPDGKAYLEEKYAEYCEFMKKSNTIEKKLLDQLSTLPYLEKHSRTIRDKYINLSKQISSNNLLTNMDNSFYTQTNMSYSKASTDNTSDKLNFSTITCGNPNEKNVRFLDNKTDDSHDSPDTNI
jgi:hypothetical protein